jgi:putative FmdB family regulatory protein
MPTYDFQCASCNHKQEAFLFVNEPFPPCEKCGKEVERLVSGTSFIRKGAGLYSLDVEKPPNMGEL